MNKSLLVIMVMLSVVVIAGCGVETYKNINAEQAKALMNESDYILLDVRTIEEYEENHVPGSILIPVHELESRLDELDKDKKYLVLCRSGNRSVTASEILIKNGFENVNNITGGILQW